MPPKKKKKSKKMTKAQRLKMLQLEEERRLREEEEARLRAEREERRRIERELKRQEIEMLDLRDKERRDGEQAELLMLLEATRESVMAWELETAEELKWARYMRCDGIPDPTDTREINTFISLWRDDPEVDITQVLEQSGFALQLMDELHTLMEEDPNEAPKYGEVIVTLKELICFKHLLATEDMLKNASHNIDRDTDNMQAEVADDNVTLCVWANLRKRSRFKGFFFEKSSLGFEIPSCLAVSDIGIRILHTHYDHLSALSRKPAPPRSLQFYSFPSPKDPEEEGDVEDHLELIDDDDDDDDLWPSLAPSLAPSAALSGPHSAPLSLIASRTSAEVKTSAKLTPDLPDLTSGHVITQMEILANSENIVKPVCDEVVDLKKYTPIGGVFYYDIFHLPPQANAVNDWEIQQMVDTGLKVFPYPTEKAAVEEGDAAGCTLVGVTVTLPAWVQWLKTPRVACWDAAGKQWQMPALTDFSYEEAEMKLSFKMESFQPFSLMQEIYANLPFKSWELRPMDRNVALYTVNGAVLELGILIQDNQCMLQLESDKALTHLQGKWLSRPVLQKAMLEAGINIFVNDSSEDYVTTCKKDPVTEHAVYEQMALFASSCAFSWSKWNIKSGEKHLVLQACEDFAPSFGPDQPWGVYMMGAGRFQKLKINDSSKKFSRDHEAGTEFHSTFTHMLQDSMSDKAIARTRESNFLFVDTVQSLLFATRPLLFSS